MDNCSQILPIVLKDFHVALENYHQSIADDKRCKKTSGHICSDHYIKINRTELQTQSELYNLLFKTCSLNK